jgi:hypothetical protein
VWDLVKRHLGPRTWRCEYELKRRDISDLHLIGEMINFERDDKASFNETPSGNIALRR